LITDPSWFYSSLAQATAGLIGLLGGVLILRLQQQSVATRESRDRVLTEFSQLRTSATSMLQNATGFIEWVKDDIRAIEDALRSGATMREVSQERDPFGSSQVGSPWRVPVSPAALEGRKRDLRIAATLAPHYAALAAVPNADGLDAPFARYRTTIASLDKEAQIRARGLLDQIEQLLRHRAIHRVRQRPWSAVGLLLVIAYLAFSSVAAPLGYLLVPRLGASAGDPFFYAFLIGLLLLFLYLALCVGQLLAGGDLKRVPQ